MRVFLSHSSRDKRVVEDVWKRLGQATAWLDKTEIDWGDVILERVATAIEEASDFVLFWSRNASESKWVRFELHMGFLRLLEQKGCKLRVVTLDQTPLPLYLRPFLFLDVSEQLADAGQIVAERLVAEAAKPRAIVRRLALDRHDELSRIERAVDSEESSVVLVQGLPGIGKRTVVGMAVETLFSPPDIRTIVVRPGTGWVELALRACAVAGSCPPQDGAPQVEVELAVRGALERIHSVGALVAFYEVQHWIEEDGGPSPILERLLQGFSDALAFAARPVFMTSTRIPDLSPAQRRKCQLVRVGGLPTAQVSALIRHWLDIEKGQVVADRGQLDTLSAELSGYPLAARIAASLVAHYGLEYVLEYPRHIVELRVDIAKDLVAAARVSTSGVRILQALAVLDAPVPGSYVAAGLGLDADEFREGVDNVLSFGLANMDGVSLALHPLVRDFYWRTLSQSPLYRDVIAALAKQTRAYLDTLEPGSEEYAVVLPTTFRLVALTGDLAGARRLRQDLVGTLLESAVQLYRRRDYALALKYLGIVLDDWADDWHARLYRARCLARTGKTTEAKSVLEDMRRQRPHSVPVLHALGRACMAEQDWTAALQLFSDALSQWPKHIGSLRDSAECCLRLDDLANAEGFVKQAKEVDSTNPYVLQVESLIMERKHLLEEAYQSMTEALEHDPGNAAFEHRLGRIAQQRGHRDTALHHYEAAVELDERFIEAHLSRVSLLVDMDQRDDAQAAIERLRADVHGRSARVLRGIEGKLALARGDLDGALDLVKGDRAPSSYALRAKVEIRRVSSHRESGYTQLAKQSLDAAHRHVAAGLKRHPANEGLVELQAEIQAELETF